MSQKHSQLPEIGLMSSSTSLKLRVWTNHPGDSCYSQSCNRAWQIAFSGRQCHHELSSPEKRNMLLGSRLEKTVQHCSWVMTPQEPMIVCQSDTPRAMKGFSKLHLIWETNENAWVIINIFQQFCVTICPEVRR
ncbi:hypothetical protein L798_01082 [Zootermopsis nevadensis]|uniref:Uncharacterized protein n=1 Tax=Zootermopsis nevadensis TaxID=136037 RepID=A0A067REQ7_ZOONE|nr:hypothetical protein L798_01082 [Zootermopsis nevadensis]